MSHSLIEMTLS